MATALIRTAASSGTQSASSVRVKTLNRKHQEYLFLIKAWEMLNMLYEGGVLLQNNVDKFLVRRPKEMFDVFSERSRRLTYQDILQSCISWHLSKMFQREPVVNFKDKGNEIFSEFKEDCNLSGKSFTQFSSDMLEKMMLFGRAFILIDKPNVKNKSSILTRLDERNAGVDRPYTLLFDPRNVINWSKDRFGNLEWVVIKTVDFAQESALDPVAVTVNWWIFDQNGYKKYQYAVPKEMEDYSLDVFFGSDFSPIGGSTDPLAMLVDEGEHALSAIGKVPIIMAQLPTHLWHSMRAYLHLLEHVDAINGHSWKLFMANLPQLVVFSEEEVTGKTLSETGLIQLGTNDKIEWLEPKGSSFQESRLHISNTRQEIYRAFHLQAQARDASATADGASGYSKEVEMMPAVDVLNALGDVERACMQNVCCFVKLAAGGYADGEERPDVEGFNFETKPTLRDIEKYEAASEAGIIQMSPTLEKSLANDIAMDLTDGKNATLRAKITEEIDKSPSQFDLAEEQRKRVAAGGTVDPESSVGADQKAFKDAYNTRYARTSAIGVIKDLGAST